MKKSPRLFHAPYWASILAKFRRQHINTFNPRISLIVLAAISVCLLWTPSSHAQSQSGIFKAYGPVSFVRATGAPTPVNATFNALDPSTTFTMRIDSSGVSSALVRLNGVEIFKPGDFNATIRSLTKPVTLQATNNLTVEMRGSPGESLDLEIIGVDTIAPTITGVVTPAPNAAGWNNANATVSFTCSDVTSGIASCPEPVTVTAETTGQSVAGVATDNAGNAASTLVTVKLDKTPPVLNVTSLTSGAKVFISPLAINGTVTETLSGLASFTCNNTPTIINGGNFTCNITLMPGSNSINLRATDIAGNNNDLAPLAVVFAPVPKVTFTSPANLSYLNLSPTTVTGTIDDPTATLTINSIATPVANGQFSVMLPLAEGPNIITATATSGAGAVGTTSMEVTLDTTPPHVTITSPADKFVTTESSISIVGNINDIVVGTVNDQQAQVTVSGLAAQVANRTFLATNVPLQMGPNVIQAVARDRVGNAATTQIVINREAVTQAQIRPISGNNQSAIIGTAVPAPLVVALTDADGNPVSNKQVIFKVTQDDGTISTGGNFAPSAIAMTDAQGLAQVQWKLGMRAGAGANSVEAYSVGFAGTAIFAATGTLGPAGKIVIDTGNNQLSEINKPLPKPLIAVVVDNGHNRLGGVPVTFTVKKGGGSFAGQTSFTVNTDSDGRAVATLTLGFQEGNANNLVEASFPSNQSFPASFTASGRAPGEVAKTSISGVVLDNSNIPIPGVTIRAVLTQVLNANMSIVQSVAAVQTNEQGQFTIQQAPVGIVKLLVDGSTAQRSGTYPSLDYDMVTVAGLNNTVGAPIFLLPLNTANQLCVTATSGGGTLTIPEAPGFSLTFGPGQVTFPGGSKTGCVSVTVVHADKVPMSPGFGQQPRFIVTIQPAGAVFNPPARITLPNVDGLAPRSITEMYSFDHDIGSFVAVGTGTVSDDGQVIRSNPGIGVLKAGWHCGGNPAAPGSVADCPDCQTCPGNNCISDPTQDETSCDDKNRETVEDKCQQGSCAGTQISLEFKEIWSDQLAGIKANSLPGHAGITGNRLKYILMGARDGAGFFKGELKVTPDTEEARSRVRVAVISDNTIRTQGSLSGSTASASVPSTSGQVTDFQLVAGIDKNENSMLDMDEISVRHDALGVFRVVPDSVYRSNQEFAALGAAVFGLPFIFPNAGALLTFFASGTVPSGATGTSREVAISNPSLSHAVGALWGNNRLAQIPRLDFGPTSSFAVAVAGSSPFNESLRNTLKVEEHGTEVKTFFDNPANSSVTRRVFGPWNIIGNAGNGNNINFEKDADLSRAIGTGTISGQVRVEVTKEGTSLKVTAIEAVNVTVSDLYDFDYEGGSISQRAATVQAGYNTLGNGGQIFWTFINLKGALPVPTFNF